MSAGQRGTRKRLEGHDAEAQLFHEADYRPVNTGNADGSGIGIETLGKRRPNSTDPAAGIGSRLEDEHAAPGLSKQIGGPQTREQICAEMRDGGAVVATARPEVEVNKSIDYWLLTESEKRHKYRKRKIKIVPPRLRRVGDKVALIEARER